MGEGVVEEGGGGGLGKKVLPWGGMGLGWMYRCIWFGQLLVPQLERCLDLSCNHFLRSSFIELFTLPMLELLRPVEVI